MKKCVASLANRLLHFQGHLKNKTYQIYNQLTESWQFTETAFILLFNKRDLFDTLSADFDFKQHNPSVRK